jgi:hypothetical protein
MINRLLTSAFLLLCCAGMQAQQWPAVTTEMRPASRWWWMGSAVDSVNLTYNLEVYARAGLGTMEITPIYGVQGNEAREIDFLTPAWMRMLDYTEKEAARLGMQIDMNTGTGWPFGSPNVSMEDAACRLLTETYIIKGGERRELTVVPGDERQRPVATLQRVMAFGDGRRMDITRYMKGNKLTWQAPRGADWTVIALFCGKTLQRVKRAAPGGEGWVLNHFSRDAVARYLDHFTTAFTRNGTPYPHNFFNDSYEVYGADWTDRLLEEFLRRRGYKLEEYLPEFLSAERTDAARRIVADYRETLGELLLENFTRQWTEWTHRHGSRTRNQAHGSPGNLIDLYATVDVPECESFGLSDFRLKGLRVDTPYTRKNDSDRSMLMYASSAAHIAGKPYTSAETFTWLTEHFRTSLSQCKPDLDLMFVSGVNHVYFHGTTYSPRQAAWPGWKFYASVDMSPTNSVWRDAPAFFDYITRCQSFLQAGKPDNDFLLYLPVYDIWHELPGRMVMFDIHGMAKRAPRFIAAVNRMVERGYSVDYISDHFIRTATCRDGKIVTSGGSAYKALVVPAARLMPADVLNKLLQLARAGAKIVFTEHYPEDVPGYLPKDRALFRQALSELRTLDTCLDETGTRSKDRLADATSVLPEAGLSEAWKYIRRRTSDGYIYFITNLSGDDTPVRPVPLAVPMRSALLYNPLNGTCGKAEVTTSNDRQHSVRLGLASGESIILRTFDRTETEAPRYTFWKPTADTLVIRNGNWGFHYDEATTVQYTASFTLPSLPADSEWQLDLGDVRESARVRINGHDVATLFAVPFRCLIGQYLRAGDNRLEVEVTTLPANRIAAMDRQGVRWRKFKDTNIVNIHYRPTTYGAWAPVAGGIGGEPVIRQLTIDN